MTNTGLIRVLIGMIGAVVCFVSFINVWTTWMKSADTSFHWTIAVIGAVMWLQALPIMRAGEREYIRKRAQELRKGKG
jgi:hypothetical protein